VKSLPLGDVIDGHVLVNLTSGTSQQARDTAQWAGGRPPSTSHPGHCSV
jgi:hypothetical protein